MNGFTKIEVLIVGIIALLIIGFDVFIISYLNDKGYHVQTLSEISQIRSGLETFLLVNNYYPIETSQVNLNDSYAQTQKLCIEGFKKYTDSCQRTIMNPLPNFYADQGNIYIYKSTDDNKNYQIEFTLKTDFKAQGLKKGKNCATNFQITSQPCF